MKTQTIEEKIKVIKQAMKYGVAIVLGNYYSVNSQTIGDRNVIPLKIKGDNVLCFDLDKNGEWRQFKLERILGNVYDM